MAQGTLYIISAASGTGKTSLVQALLQKTSAVKISVSYTTRLKRVDEDVDRHYHFVSKEEFNKLIAQDFFLEYAQVFTHYYGTPRLWVMEQLDKGIDVILTIDWQGAYKIKQQLECVSIFLLPPSLAELQRRLQKRGSENTTTLATRLAGASEEISHHKEFDYVIINDKFTEAVLDILAIIRSQRLRVEKQRLRNSNLLESLIAKGK